MPLPTIPSGNVFSSLPTGFDVENSCRFNAGDEPRMEKTQGTSTNADKFTLSFWFKLGSGMLDGAAYVFVSEGTGLDPQSSIYINPDVDHALTVYGRDPAGANIWSVTTNRLFRDVGAWYHIVWAYDSTESTEADRVKVYINGVQETSFNSASYPGSNVDGEFNRGGTKHTIGAFDANGTMMRWIDGYMAELVFIDGTAYAASDFGEFDEDSPTIWKPKDPSDLTFGTNGYYLDFKDSANLGNDANGGTDFTEYNLAATDSSTDTPTNNFCVMNPLDNFYAASTFSEGNCKIVTASSTYTMNTATVGLTAGKWYWETKLVADTASGAEFQFGITDIVSTATTVQLGVTAYSYAYTTENGLVKNNNSTSSFGATAAVGDIIGVALDLTNLKIYFSKNGTWQNSGDPTSGATGTGAAFTVTAPASTTGGQYFPALGEGTGIAQLTYGFNFGGCPSFAISSGNTDGNGYGNMEYSVPSGYYTLCTKNLAEYG
jgi:hypothetical protein